MKNVVLLRNAFTLIELMVVITIMGIIMFATYIPYEHHQKKTALRQGASEISQSLSEARNLAIHGLDTGSGNLTVTLSFIPGERKIYYYAYPYQETPVRDSLKEEYNFKTKNLPRGIVIESIDGGRDPYIFTFFAISGSGNIVGGVVPILLSYEGSQERVLQKEILYYPQSNISDYY